MPSTIFSRLKFLIGADNKQFLTGIQQSQRQLVGFTRQVQGFTRILGGAFAGFEVGSFILDASKLAESAKGIKIAFDDLNQPNLLDDLQKATRDTVAEIDLMRQAVRASNFKIPLQNLATFFEFARQRAAATGESVDFLVNSIIDGIGRKSTLVLDNLGISASELQSEIKKVGDFGQAAANIIEREMAKVPDSLKDVTTSTDQLNAAWKNFKISVGQNTEGALADVKRFATEALRILSDPTLQKIIAGSSLQGVTQAAAGVRNFTPIGLLPQVGSLFSSGASAAGGSANNPFQIDNQGLSNINKFKTDLLQIQLTTARLQNARLSAIVPPELVDRVANMQERLANIKRLFQGTLGKNFNSESLNRIDALDAGLRDRFSGVTDVGQSFNSTLNETLAITQSLQGAFNSLFQSIISGGGDAESIFKSLISGIFSTGLNIISGGLFGGASALLSSSGSLTATVTNNQLQFVQSTGKGTSQAMGF